MRILTIKEVQAMQLELMKKLHAYLEEKKIPYYMIAGSVLGAVRHGGFIPWDDDIDIGMLRPEYEKFLSVCRDFDGAYDIVNYRNRRYCDTCLTRIYFPGTMIDNKSIANTKLDKRLYFDIFPLDKAPDDEKERNELERKILKKKKQIYFTDARNYNDTGYVLFLKKLRSLLLAPRRENLLSECDKLMQSYGSRQTKYICSMCSQYSFQKQAMPKEYYGTPTLHRFEDAEFYVPEQTDAYLKHLYGADYMEIPPESKRRKGCAIYKLGEE
jgi:lipopolysaccharide cholinephosphotransferase